MIAVRYRGCSTRTPRTTHQPCRRQRRCFPACRCCRCSIRRRSAHSWARTCPSHRKARRSRTSSTNRRSARTRAPCCPGCRCCPSSNPRSSWRTVHQWSRRRRFRTTCRHRKARRRGPRHHRSCWHCQACRRSRRSTRCSCLARRWWRSVRTSQRDSPPRRCTDRKRRRPFRTQVRRCPPGRRRPHSNRHNSQARRWRPAPPDRMRQAPERCKEDQPSMSSSFSPPRWDELKRCQEPARVFTDAAGSPPGAVCRLAIHDAATPSFFFEGQSTTLLIERDGSHGGTFVDF